MVMREISLCLLLGHLQAGVYSTCIPVWCLRCNITGVTQADPCALCSNYSAQCRTEPSDIPQNCIKEFQVSVNSTGSVVQEGEDITLTCVHNLMDFIRMWWEKDAEEILGVQNKSMLALKTVTQRNKGQYICFVHSPCGTYKSSPQDVTVKSSNEVLLIICGVSALVLVVSMGLAMKFKLKRDNAKHKERMKQRAQAGQGGGPAALAPRES